MNAVRNVAGVVQDAGDGPRYINAIVQHIGSRPFAL